METAGLVMVIVGAVLAGAIEQRHYRKTGYGSPMPGRRRLTQLLLICVMTAGAIMIFMSEGRHGG